MPFSGTAACTEAEWSEVFDTVIKPAVEEAGLGYECRRSNATRGNIVAQILESLRDGHVVIADLTDRNANVFYELGVRHALKDRTILLAQDRNAIPFDLLPYANHVYNWRTDEGRAEFKRKIRDLLLEIDENPDRPDNPVSDFLRDRAQIPVPEPPPTLTRAEAYSAQALAGPMSEGVDPSELARNIARSGDPSVLRTTVRLTRAYLRDDWIKRIAEKNAKVSGASITRDDLYEVALREVKDFEPAILKLEEFGLGLIDSERFGDLQSIFRLIEQWISLSTRAWPGTSSKIAVGVPSLLALRVLANWSAKAIDNGSMEGLGTLLFTPLQSEAFGGQPVSQCLVEREDMFYSQAFLGHADDTLRYICQESVKSEGIMKFFSNDRDYLGALAVFFFMVDFMFFPRHAADNYRVFPAFRLIPGGPDAVRAFLDRMKSNGDLFAEVARLAGEDVPSFKQKWPERIKHINEAKLGGDRDLFDRGRDKLPETLD